MGAAVVAPLLVVALLTSVGPETFLNQTIGR
jgi:hypothetical protein